MGLSEYLDTLTAQIRCKSAREMVADEVRSHIEDQACAFETEGMEKDQALLAAVKEMGDPVAAGVELDRIHRPKTEWRILLLAVLISLIGLGIQYAVCTTWMDNRFHDSVQMVTYFFIRQCGYMAVGLLVMLLVYRLDYSIIGKMPLILWAVMCLLVLVMVSTGVRVNGAVRTYSVLTLFAPLYAGVLYRFRKSGLWGLCACVLLGFIPMWLALVSVQATAAIELFMVFFIMVQYAVVKGWFDLPVKRTAACLWAAIPALFVLGNSLGILKDYQRDRINFFLHPWQFHSTGNYLRGLILDYVEDFKLIGGTGISAENNPLQVNYDYIITFLYSYFGILAGSLVLFLILFLIGKCLGVSMRQKNQLGAMVGLGCSGILLTQTITYVLSNFGIGLLTQKTMPFLSFGLQGMIANGILVGLILSIYRYKDITAENKIRGRFSLRIKIEKTEKRNMGI